jgi:OmpA-OmpF porin, OOP family
MKNLMKYSAIAVGMMTSAAVMAETDWNCYDKKGTDFQSCPYIGAGLGYAHLNPDTSDTGWDESGKNNLGGLLFVGYHFAPNWFVEAAYADLGEVDLKNENLLVTPRKGTIGYQVPNIMGGYYIDVGNFPIDPFVKVGLSAIQNDTSSSGIKYEDEHGVQLALGAGFDWRFAKQWKLRTALDSYDEDAFLGYVGVAYIFGEGKAKPVPAPEPVPVPVPAPAPEPAPVVEVVPPAPVITEELCNIFEGSLEGVHFKTASAELTDTSRNTLSKSAALLKQFPSVMVEVHAHTDSQGSATYNQELSMNRAKSVRSYFVSQGVAESRMTAEGFGEDQPIADNATADGRALNRRVELVSHIEQCQKK